MPFTLSHAALVLPVTYLPKKAYSLTGLVIGSFVPDFESFLRMKDYSIYSHTWLGLFWFDLPLAFMLAYIFHSVIRNALLENLPRSIFIRFSEAKKFNWNEYLKKNWIIVIISILLGAASHLFWDSFTHRYGYFATHISFLNESVTFFGIRNRFFNFFQYICSLLGGLILIYSIFRLPKDEQAMQNSDRIYWFYIAFICLIVFGFKLLTGLNYKSFDLTITTFISCGLISLSVTSFFYRVNYIR
jgi:hypothetical protein